MRNDLQPPNMRKSLRPAAPVIKEPFLQRISRGMKPWPFLARFLYKVFGLYRVNIEGLRVGEFPALKLGQWIIRTAPDKLKIPFGMDTTCEGRGLEAAIKKGWFLPCPEYGKIEEAKPFIVPEKPEPFKYGTELSIRSKMERDPVAYEAVVEYEGGPILGYIRGGCTDEEIRSFYEDKLAALESQDRGPIIDD